MPRKQDGMPFEVHPSPMKGKDGKNLLYVRPRSGQKVTMRQLDEYCAQHYALRPGELTRSFNAFIQADGLLPCRRLSAGDAYRHVCPEDRTMP